MVMTDCFAYARFGDSENVRFEMCKALDALYCRVEECKFYKNKEQACRECLYDDCKGCAGKHNRNCL